MLLFEPLALDVFHTLETTGQIRYNQSHCHVCLLDIVLNIKGTNVFIHLLVNFIYQGMLCLMRLSCLTLSQPSYMIITLLMENYLALQIGIINLL